MKNFIRIALLFLVIAACQKPAGDLIGKEVIIGRLFLRDTITQQALNLPLAGKKVMIRYTASTDTLNFLYSATTDANGYFTFPNLTSGTSYTVFYDEIVAGVTYHGSGIATAPANNLAVTALVSFAGQSGLFFDVRDYSGNILKGATICLFTSATAPGYVKNVCDGSSYSLTTDANGHATLFNINPGTYYFISSATENTIPLIYTGSVKLSNSVSTSNITLQKQNGIEVIATDSQGNPITGAATCAFTSSQLFLQGVCDGSSFSLTSAADGTATQYNLPKGKYYLLGTIMINNAPWIARDSVLVADTVSAIKLQFKPKTN